MKILIVEDNLVDRTVLRQFLQRGGHEVVEVADGDQAWSLLQRDPFRLVVSDWEMPKATGLDLCRRIRARREGEYVYFILISANDASEENQQLAAEAGVDDFLTKPFKMLELSVRIRVAERILRCGAQVRRLEGLLPICSYCKKIRDDRNYWQQIEQFIQERTDSEFSHSVCPDCFERVVGRQLDALGIPTPEGPGPLQP
ncbi:MAG TPA: response regulator [Candidatus Didemnitutus sp.]|jgi:DNA-binding response OmpR family regulator